MLGRFLEISVVTPDILASLQFYESLGLQQVRVGETWTHPYAVVSDGRLFLGLHQRTSAALSITYVQPDLKRHLGRLRELGVNFEQEHVAADAFNYASFRDPHGLHVDILEARTFSPPDIGGDAASMCGYFTELGIPARDFEPGRQFWEPLGFVAMSSDGAVPRMSLTGDHFNLGLLRTRSLRQPVLVFEDEEMGARLEQLRHRGFTLSDDMPDSLDAAANAVIEAPEGTKLMLLQTQS